VNRRFSYALAAAAAVVAFGASPALASAKHKHPKPPPSAWDVYTQQLPTSKGPKPVNHAGGGAQSGQSGGYVVQPVQLSSHAATNLKHQGGKDTAILKTIGTSSALGVEKVTAAAGPINERSPSALGAVGGTGSGPIVLFGALIAGAVLLFWLGRLSGRRAERR
jgi:hypothetical protein